MGNISDTDRIGVELVVKVIALNSVKYIRDNL